jgi:ABC-2 type transport system ATP-binding protein
MAVLLSTPYMDEAERCNRVGLIHHGELLVEGPPQELLRDFDHETFEVLGGDRTQVVAVVEHRPEVRASSPVGASLKVVVAPGGRAALEQALAPLGARLGPAAPDFEDLFLARIAEKGNA